MFGLGKKRKIYNGDVDTKLTADYRINTHDNPLFPGVLKYLEFIDKAWDSGMNKDEAALYIATLYYLGLYNKGHTTEAESLLNRINSIGAIEFSNGKISSRIWNAASKDIANAAINTAKVQAAPSAPDMMFMAELPHPEANTPKDVQNHGKHTFLYYENPKTIGNVSGGMPSVYNYPQCAVVSEGNTPVMIVRVEESPFGSMLCSITPTGQRSNMGPFNKTSREAFLAKVAEILG